MYSLTQFHPGSYSQKLRCNITSRLLTLIRYTDLIQISPVLLALLCARMCAVSAMLFYHMCKFVHLLPKSKYQIVLTTQEHLMLPFYNPIPNPWKSLICPPLLKFCHFKKYYKWNHPACTLLRLAFFHSA